MLGHTQPDPRRMTDVKSRKGGAELERKRCSRLARATSHFQLAFNVQSRGSPPRACGTPTATRRPLEVLVDDLAAEPHPMLAWKNFVHLVLAVEQRDDAPRTSAAARCRDTCGSSLPNASDEVPRLVAAGGVEQQRMHQVGRVLRAHLAVERHLHRLAQKSRRRKFASENR